MLLSGFLTFAGIGPGSPQPAHATPSYYPSGPKTSVTKTTVTDGGWELCYSGLMNVPGGTLESEITSNCTEDYVLVAAAPVGSSTFTLLAAAPRTEVFEATSGNNQNVANGTGWYFRSGYSMGFAAVGDALSLSSCDVNRTGSDSLRMCFHFGGAGGYRVGGTLGLNGATDWERFFYQTPGVPKVSSFTAASNLTSAVSFQYSLQFPNSVTGLTAADFDFTGSTATGCTATPNTSSGSSFTVTVSSCSEGTVQLNLKSNAVSLASDVTKLGPTSRASANSVTVDRGAPSLALEAPVSPNSNSSLVFTVTSSEVLASVVAGDFSVQGTGCAVGTPSGPTGSAPNLLYSIPVTGCHDAQTVTLTLLQDSVQDAAANTAPVTALVSSPVIVDLTAPTAFVTGDAVTNSEPVSFTVSLSETIQGSLDQSDFTVGGSGCAWGGIAPAGSQYTVTLSGCVDGTTATLTLNSGALLDLAGNSGPSSNVTAQTVIDRSLAAITIDAPASPNSSSSFVFGVNLGESTSNLEESDFELVTSGTHSCAVDAFNPASPRDGESGTFNVGVSGCSHGDQVALQLKPNTLVDPLNNLGPLSAISSSTVVVDLLAPTLVGVVTNNSARTNQSTITYQVTFNETVQFLDASMFSIAAGTSCSGASLSGSQSTYTVSFSGCVTGDVVTLSYSITTAVKDLAGNPIVAVSDSLPGITVDVTAPTITSISKVQHETHVVYTVDFSEQVVGISAADIEFGGTSAQGSSWTVSGLVALSDTRYRFSAVNDYPDSGTLSFSFVASGVRDLAGNDLASGQYLISSVDQSQVEFYFLPTISLGTVSQLGSKANSIAPQVVIDGRGNSIFGIRVTMSGAQAGDLLAFTNSSAATFGSIQTATNNSILTLTYSGAQPSIAQWQAAARAVTFQTTSVASVSRSVTFEIKAKENYLFETGHFYEVKSSSFSSWSDAFDLAETYSFAGMQGYMVNITSAAEQTHVQTLANGNGAWLGHNDVQNEGNWILATGPEAGTPATYSNWSSSEPNNTSDFVMLMATGKWDDLTDASPNSGAYAITALIVEYGGMAGDAVSQLSASADLQIDSIPPTVSSVGSSTVDGTYYRGEQINLVLTFSEAVLVSGAPQLKLETGAADQYASYVSGSGTSALLFSHEVTQTDATSDLDYHSTSALELNSGTITDLVGNDAVLTLPTPGQAGSLASSSAIVLDGAQVEMVLQTASTSANVRALTFSLVATAALDCTSLSTTLGEDLEGTNIASIDSVTASGDNKTCNINLTSTILPAQFGTTTLTYTHGFSVSDQVGNPQTNISLGLNSVVLTIPPAAPGKGDFSVSPTAGTIPGQLERGLAQALLPGVGPTTLASLRNLGVNDAPALAPKRLMEVDHSGVLNPNEQLNSRMRTSIDAGASLSIWFKVEPSIAAGSVAASYLKVGSTWIYTGSSAFTSGEILTNEVTFTNAGNYEIRIFVVTQGTQIATQSQNFGFGYGFQPQISLQSISESNLPTTSQSAEIHVEVNGQVQTYTPPPPTPTPTNVPATEAVPTPTPTPTPTPVPTQTPAPSPSPTQAATDSTPAPTPSSGTKPQVEPSPTPSSEPSEVSTPIPLPEPGETGNPDDNLEPSTNAAAEPRAEAGTPESLVDVAQAVLGALGDLFNIEIPPLGEPVANAAIGASGDDTVIVEFDPLGTPEASAATANLVAASVAILGAAAAAAAAVGAASAAGAAASGASSSSASSSSSGTTETNNDATDAIAEAAFDVDAFSGTPPGKGDTLPLWSMAWLAFLDRPTRAATIMTHRFSPLLSKMINDGIYLRASMGSLSVLPVVAAVVLAILGLQENEGVLLHPPVLIFMAIALIGIFDSMAGAVGIGVFVFGSLPLVDPQSATDWRMLAGTMVAGFGPIVLGRSIRNFRRRSVTGLDGFLARIGDIAFVGLMGGWVAGLAFRALPALTGLTVPAANYVGTFQLFATIAIVVRILLEDGTGRLFPRRMDELSPDSLEPVSKVQLAISMPMKFMFFVFIASSFMGLGFTVWLAAIIFIAPSIVKLVSYRLPNSLFLWRWLPVGLPGLASILGLEILMNALLTPLIGDRDDYGVIFTLFLLGMISVFGILGSFGREGQEGETRLFERASMRWVARVGAVVIFVLLIQFTSML